MKSLPTAGDPLSAARYLAKERFNDSWVSLGDGLIFGELIILEENLSPLGMKMSGVAILDVKGNAF